MRSDIIPGGIFPDYVLPGHLGWRGRGGMRYADVPWKRDQAPRLR
jgi:hypothetical protein